MINFHQDDESYQIVDFSSKYRVFLKKLNLHHNDDFFFQNDEFYQNDDLSPHWLSSVKTINLYRTDEFYIIDELSS